MALGNFYARRGQLGNAEAEYKAALSLNAQFAPAAINLADLYRQLGQDAEGEAVLRNAITALPNDAGLHHALGLALMRLKRPDAEEFFERQAAVWAGHRLVTGLARRVWALPMGTQKSPAREGAP